MGLAYGETGALDKAIENYQKSLDICEEVGDLKSKRRALAALNNIGENYRFKGELELALNYYNQCLDLSKRSKEKSGMAVSYHNIGLVYKERGDIADSLDYLKKGLEINKELGNRFEISRSLFDIISNHIDSNKIESLHPLLQELKKLSENENNSRIINRYRIADALFLKNSGRSRNIHKAEEILYSLLEDPTVESELLVIINLNLCELLFKELQITNEPEILEDITPLVEKLGIIANKERSFTLYAEFFYLKSKLALLHLNILESQTYLTQAQQIAQKYSLTRLERQISMEHDDLLKKIEIWNELKEKDAPIADRLKFATIENDLKIIMKKKEIEPIDILPEEPLFLSIISKGGLTLFTHFFKKEWEKKELFSSFMSAFNTFSKELFSKTLDRVKIGENTIILMPFNDNIFCYVIKGQTYPALKRLDHFLKEIRNSQEIMNDIDNALEKNLILNDENYPLLKDLIDSVFINSS